jgi:hypothetical protein
MLGRAGWPRKLGMFKGEGYSAFMVDITLAQSVDFGATLGAGRPRLALEMIAQMFDGGDWEGAPGMKAFVEGASERWSTAASPREAVTPTPQFADDDMSGALSVKQYENSLPWTSMENILLQALLWGLSYPDRVETSFNSSHENWAEYREVGLDIPEHPPSFEQYVQECELLVRDYERDLGHPFPPIPPRLLADAEQLGWRV